MLRKSMLAIPLAVAVLAAPVPADAAGAVVLAEAAAASGADAAARAAAARSGGRVLDVRKRVDEGRSTYEVRVLLGDGRVRVIRVDGEDTPANPPGRD